MRIVFVESRNDLRVDLDFEVGGMIGDTEILKCRWDDVYKSGGKLARGS